MGKGATHPAGLFRSPGSVLVVALSDLSLVEDVGLKGGKSPTVNF